MKLVRTIKQAAIVYYWKLDEELEPNSPIFKTMDQAREWMTKRFFALYDGPERRASVIDRRHNFERRNAQSPVGEKVVSMNPIGRRAADQYRYTLVDRVGSIMDQLRSGEISLNVLR